jgi:hypothetical protein
LITISNGFYDFLINDDDKIARWVCNFEHLTGLDVRRFRSTVKVEIVLSQCNINVVYHG